MKLSILIPTHNRPELFTRCLNSVLAQLTTDVEIIVNNDSNDITEIKHNRVTYHYHKYNNLSMVYQFLYNRAQGEYVYFLEDDDYLADDFLQKIQLDADIVAGNYCPTYTEHKLEYMRLFSNATVYPQDFVNNLNLEHLQLSQFVFKRGTIGNIMLPMDSNVHNDIMLVIHAATNAKTVRTMNKVFFYQTIDGGDNISFEGMNSSISTTQHTDFLSEYEIYKAVPHTTGS